MFGAAIAVVSPHVAAITPEAAEVQIQVARLLFADGRYVEAFDAFEHAKPIEDSRIHREALAGSITAALRLGDFSHAYADAQTLMKTGVKDAESLSLLQLADALTELTEAARAGKTTPADLSGGTISITNIGVFGIDAGTPILNPGEAAILAVGAVRNTPWEYQGEVALRQVLTLSLSFDHRLVDGEQGSRFLADVGAILADPGMVLAMV